MLVFGAVMPPEDRIIFVDIYGDISSLHPLRTISVILSLLLASN